jgi:hypothetical protein
VYIRHHLYIKALSLQLRNPKRNRCEKNVNNMHWMSHNTYNNFLTCHDNTAYKTMNYSNVHELNHFSAYRNTYRTNPENTETDPLKRIQRGVGRQCSAQQAIKPSSPQGGGGGSLIQADDEER